jgi:hypothetical protein
MTGPTFQIIGFRLVRERAGRPFANCLPIAHFDIAVSGIALNSCMFAWNKAGQLTVYGPYSRHEQRKRGAAVLFQDHQLRSAITAAALSVYRSIANSEPLLQHGDTDSSDVAGVIRLTNSPKRESA